MIIGKIQFFAQERKSKLTHYLNNNKDISLDRQHQMYGAISEIDSILIMIRNLKE